MRYILFLCLSVLLYSCAAPIQDLTKTQYISPDFSMKQIAEGGIALLPVTALQGFEGYKRKLGDYLNQKLKKAVPGENVLKWQETGELLNKHSKVNTYEDIIQSYKETSIIKKDQVKELKEALNVRFAFYCLLQNSTESIENSYGSLSGWKTTTKGNVQVFCLIIDMETGYIVQEITGQAISIDEDNYKENYDEYLTMIATSVLSQIPGANFREE